MSNTGTSAVAAVPPPPPPPTMSKSDQRAYAMKSIGEIMREVFDVPAVLRGKKQVGELAGLGGMLMSNSLIGVRMLTTTITLELDKQVVSAIYMRDMRGFTFSMTRKVLLAMFQNLQWSAREWVSTRVALAWMKKLTRSIHGRYFDSMAYYRLSAGSVTDAEERITNDVRTACMRLSWQVSEVAESVLMAGYYSFRLGRNLGSSYVLFCIFYGAPSPHIRWSLRVSALVSTVVSALPRKPHLRPVVQPGSRYGCGRLSPRASRRARRLGPFRRSRASTAPPTPGCCSTLRRSCAMGALGARWPGSARVRQRSSRSGGRCATSGSSRLVR